MNLSTLTYALFELNMILDSGKYSDISVDVMIDQIESKNVLPFLEEKLGSEYDFSLITVHPDKVRELHDGLFEVWGGLGGVSDLRRKTGVVNSGICMLVALIVEVIQHPDDYLSEYDWTRRV